MKNGRILWLGLGVVVLAVAAVGVLIFLNSRSSQTVSSPNTPRATNPAARPITANSNTSGQDPLDDSAEDTLPNPPDVAGAGTPAGDPLDDSAPNTNNPNIPPAQGPPASEGMVSLPGTAWIQMESDEAYNFCSDNKWQISDENDTVTGTGTFEQSTKTLTLSGDGDPRTYELTWDSAVSVLALKQGETTINLAYDGESGCP